MQKFSLVSLVLRAFVAATVLLPATPGWGQGRTDTIAQTGQAVAGGNGTYSSFSNPILNSSRQVGFPSDLTGTSEGSLDHRGSKAQDKIGDEP